MSRTTSLRARFLFIVLTLVVVPLALMGVWLTSMTSRSGEELLRSRLGDALNTTVAEIGARWVRWRSELLVLAEDTAAHRALQSGDLATPMPASLVARFNEMDIALRRMAIRDEVDEIRWHLARPERPETVGTPSVKGASIYLSQSLIKANLKIENVPYNFRGFFCSYKIGGKNQIHSNFLQFSGRIKRLNLSFLSKRIKVFIFYAAVYYIFLVISCFTVP